MEIKCQKCNTVRNINFKFSGAYICPKCSSPSLLQKAKNLTKSVTSHVSNGMKNVSDSIKNERMNICKSCPFFNHIDPKNPTCNSCGCYLEVKTAWASEKCPEGKWHEVKTASDGGCGCNKS